IIATGHGSIEHAVSAIHAGADDYLSKPFNKQTLLFTIQKVAQTKRLLVQNKQLKQALGLQEQLVDMIGKSAKMQTLFKRVEKLASTRATVLITGESGTGKELAARALHQLSDRHNHAFIAINCAAIPESLAEAEFFGTTKGAFTGANTNKKGKFELADKGTIFLDEIGELDLSIQAKLLRLLQEGTFTPIGGQKEMSADVRVLAATNRNLDEEVKAGQFREDLYFRLNVVPIVMPPLRERKDDIPLLARHFLKKASQMHGLSEPKLSSAALTALQQYYWPGNVRELNNAMERAVLLAESDTLDATDLDFDSSSSLENDVAFKLPAEGIAWQQIERDILKQALDLADNNRAEAARLLDLPYKAFLYRLEKYAL
ncbi:MAG: sigma-54-dependent Fis family transcriptional regulator, partial [Enterobacterales bacterium]|nr:sigma-54-dependent Fis family transcriptional regulator [Enterobacterales bacterium]